MNENKFNVILRRFIKAFIGGALSTAVLISVGDIKTWFELATALNALFVSMIIGGINGVILAGEKWYNYKK